MPRPKSTEKRLAMMRAAIGLFLKNGYSEVSMTQISTAAGISKSALYSHFPNKAALFMAVIKAFWAKGSVPQVDVNDTRDVSVVLKEFSHDVIGFLSKKQTINFFKTIVMESSRFDEIASAITDNNSGPMISGLRDYFSAQHNKSPEKADQAARYFLAMLREDPFWRVIARLREPYTEEERESHINNVVEFVVRLLGNI